MKGMVRTIFQHLVKVLQMFHNYISMFFENRKRNEKMKVTAQPVGPETFPQTENVCPFEFALVPDK